MENLQKVLFHAANSFITYKVPNIVFRKDAVIVFTAMPSILLAFVAPMGNRKLQVLLQGVEGGVGAEDGSGCYAQIELPQFVKT